MAFLVNADRQLNCFGTNATSVTNFDTNPIDFPIFTCLLDRVFLKLGRVILLWYLLHQLTHKCNVNCMSLLQDNFRGKLNSVSW